MKIRKMGKRENVEAENISAWFVFVEIRLMSSGAVVLSKKSVSTWTLGTTSSVWIDPENKRIKIMHAPAWDLLRSGFPRAWPHFLVSSGIHMFYECSIFGKIDCVVLVSRPLSAAFFQCINCNTTRISDVGGGKSKIDCWVTTCLVSSRGLSTV